MRAEGFRQAADVLCRRSFVFMLDSTELIREFVAIPGPPGQEGLVGEAFSARAKSIGFEPETDPKGNVVVTIPGKRKKERPKVVVTAHLDEIALMVQRIAAEGWVDVVPMGGAYPWKWGEQPVQI